jgi:hypothetical protein
MFPEAWFNMHPGSASYKNMVVHVNDELGYNAVIKLFQFTIDILESKHPELDLTSF